MNTSMNTNRKSPGQVAFENVQAPLRNPGPIDRQWDTLSPQVKSAWESGAAAVLADQWRPVNEPPEDHSDRVILLGGGNYNFREFYSKSLDHQWWAAIPPLPQPPVDPYADLKKAFSEGKRIEEASYEGHWYDSTNPTWTMPVEFYRIKPEDPYAILRAAHAAGKVIQAQWTRHVGTDIWGDISPDWTLPASQYRIKPEDPYATLKAAHAEGKVIQFETSKGLWVQENHPTWNHAPNRYRIKPWELSRHIPGFRALEDGEEWLEFAPWEERLLPQGYRPLLVGEPPQGSDENQPSRGHGFSNHSAHLLGGHWRTTRPLPPTKEELEIQQFESWWTDFKLQAVDTTPNRRTAYAAWQARANK